MNISFWKGSFLKISSSKRITVSKGIDFFLWLLIHIVKLLYKRFDLLCTTLKVNHQLWASAYIFGQLIIISILGRERSSVHMWTSSNCFHYIELTCREKCPGCETFQTTEPSLLKNLDQSQFCNQFPGLFIFLLAEMSVAVVKCSWMVEVTGWADQGAILALGWQSVARCLGILREVILKSNLQFITVNSIRRVICRSSVEILLLPPTPRPFPITIGR